MSTLIRPSPALREDGRKFALTTGHMQVESSSKPAAPRRRVQWKELTDGVGNFILSTAPTQVRLRSAAADYPTASSRKVQGKDEERKALGSRISGSVSR